MVGLNMYPMYCILNYCFKVYNVAQVKKRLQTSGLFIANTKPGGFSLEVAKTDYNTMMVGVRVKFCFTREESF